MRGLILAVSGTRRMLDEEEGRKVLDVLTPYVEQARVIHVGDCPTGIDWIVRNMATRVPVRVHEAYWDEEGHRAGPNRNRRMLEVAFSQHLRLDMEVMLAAFPNGHTFNDSPGTWGACKIAHEMKIPVKVTEV